MKRIFLPALAAIGLLAATRDFVPTTVFKGSALTGLTPVGAATWAANNGEITGTPKSPEGGWLLLDKSFQDVGVFAGFKCPAGCKAGILVRALERQYELRSDMAEAAVAAAAKDSGAETAPPPPAPADLEAFAVPCELKAMADRFRGRVERVSPVVDPGATHAPRSRQPVGRHHDGHVPVRQAVGDRRCGVHGVPEDA